MTVFVYEEPDRELILSCFVSLNASGEVLSAPSVSDGCSCAPCARQDRIGLDEREIGGGS